MHLLPVTEYECARPLFAAMRDHLAVSATLEGTAEGRVYVDDVAQPGIALAWVNRRLYLAGPPSVEAATALRRLFIETLEPAALTVGMDVLILHFAPGGWEQAIEGVILEGRRQLKGRREYYRCNALRADWRRHLQAGFTLRPVDAALLADARLQHREALMAEMCSERVSVGDFLARSFGVCAVYGDEIAGWCLSEYNTTDVCEVGIETLEPYQRRGLATAMTLALVAEALARGLSYVGWHCYADNAPSVATALKAGFVKVQDYPAYVVWLPGPGA
jgi:RimJ/RimL family protein N-acetyltransferase